MTCHTWLQGTIHTSLNCLKKLLSNKLRKVFFVSKCDFMQWSNERSEFNKYIVWQTLPLFQSFSSQVIKKYIRTYQWDDAWKRGFFLKCFWFSTLACTITDVHLSRPVVFRHFYTRRNSKTTSPDSDTLHFYHFNFCSSSARESIVLTCITMYMQ